MLGMLIGAFVLGLISDYFGRRVAFALSILLAGGGGLLATFSSQSTAAFGIFRIIEGMGGMGCYLIPYVMVAESAIPT